MSSLKDVALARGQAGEHLAASILREKCDFVAPIESGNADLICRYKGVYISVEVKTTSSEKDNRSLGFTLSKKQNNSADFFALCDISKRICVFKKVKKSLKFTRIKRTEFTRENEQKSLERALDNARKIKKITD
jgi:hypothetical protein